MPEKRAIPAHGGSSEAATELALDADERADPKSWRSTVRRSEASLLAAAVLIGTLTALANVAFRWTIESAHRLFWIDLAGLFALTSLEKYDIFTRGLAAIPDNWWYIPLIPMAGMTAIALLERLFPGEMKGYGLPRFLELVNIKGGYLRRRWITLKTVSSAITVGSGMSAGIEGPIAQIGGSIGSTVGRVIRPSFERLRVLIACGSASAIAASFRTPITGVMFAQEVVLIGEVEAHSFYLVVLSAGTSAVVSSYLKADYPILHAPAFDFPLGRDLLLLVGLGLAIGLLAVLFIDVFHRVRDALDRSPIPKSVLPIFGGLLTGVTLIFFPQIGGMGYETMNATFRVQLGTALLWALVPLKILMTSVTLGAGGSGGVFAPAMFVGTAFGGAFALTVNAIAPGTIAEPGSFALIGLGAMIAAATHAPLTGVFLLLELTRDYNSAVPAMITAITATMLARRLQPESMDTYDLRRRGVDVHVASETNILRSLHVRGLVSKDFQQVRASMPLEEFVRYVTGSRYNSFPVVDDAGELTGIVGIDDLRGVLLEREAWPNLVVGELARKDFTTLKGSDTLHEAMKLIASEGRELIPVVDEETGKRVVGMLKRSDLHNFYQKRMLARELHG